MSGQLDLVRRSRWIELARAALGPARRAPSRRGSRRLCRRGDRLPTTRELAGGSRDQPRNGPGGLPAAPGARTVEGRVGSGTVVRGELAAAAGFDADRAALSARAAAVAESDSPVGASARRRLLAPGAGRAVLPARGVHAHALRRLGQPAGPLAVRSPARPPELRAEIVAPPRRARPPRAPPTRSWSSAAPSRASTCSSGRSRTRATSWRSSRRPIPGRSRSRVLPASTIVPLPMGAGGPDPSALRAPRQARLHDARAAEPDGDHDGPRQRAGAPGAAASAAGALVVEDGYEEPESGLPPLSALDPERSDLAGHALQGPRSGLPDRLDRGGPRRSSSGSPASRRPRTSRRRCRSRRRCARFLREGADRKARASALARGRDAPDRRPSGPCGNTCRRFLVGRRGRAARSSGCTCRRACPAGASAERAARGRRRGAGSGLRSAGRGPAELAAVRLAGREAQIDEGIAFSRRRSGPSAPHRGAAGAGGLKSG